MLTYALALYGRPVDDATISDKRLKFSGPYRAVSAYKGDEDKGERDWPWIVVGQHGINCFGRLWPKAYAISVAEKMNEPG